MQKLFIRGRTVLNKEEGNILIITAFLMLVFVFLLVGLCEFGRVMVIREKTKTAADSAALAQAGSGVEKKIKINIHLDKGWQRDKKGRCNVWLGSQDWTNIEGNEKELINNQGWFINYIVPALPRVATCRPPDYYYQVVDRNVTYGDSGNNAAYGFYLANAPKGNTITSSQISQIQKHTDKKDKYAPSVVVKATTTIASLFPSIFSSDFKALVCSQGVTYYKDAKILQGIKFKGSLPKTSLWVKPPADACSDNW